METQRDAEQTMWNVLENTWDSENIEGSRRNFGVKYLKSVLVLAPHIPFPIVSGLLTSLFIRSISIPCPRSQPAIILPEDTARIPRFQDLPDL